MLNDSALKFFSKRVIPLLKIFYYNKLYNLYACVTTENPSMGLELGMKYF